MITAITNILDPVDHLVGAAIDGVGPKYGGLHRSVASSPIRASGKPERSAMSTRAMSDEEFAAVLAEFVGKLDSERRQQFVDLVTLPMRLEILEDAKTT